MNNNSECAEYFRSQPGYHRCLEELRKKWESYGRTAGKVFLSDATKEERRLLGGIVGKVFSDGDIRFSCAEFERGLQKTRFAPVDMKELLEAYFGQELITNQDQKRRKRQAKTDFLEELKAVFEKTEGEHPTASLWLGSMMTGKSDGYQLLMREYEKDREAAKILAQNVGNALEKLNLKGKAQSEDTYGEAALAVFAAEISGNPHYLDRGTTAGQLFVSAVCCCTGYPLPQNAHMWRDLMRQIGIVPDHVSSFVHAYGLCLQTAEGGHPAYEAFCRRKEPCVITLENLRGIVGAAAVGRTVFVVENEMVFSCLVERGRMREMTLLCTSGQPRTAALELMSLLVKAGCRLYYSGDMDPEGIEIADRLWRRYGDALEIWRMSPADYERGLSGEYIDDVRLSGLEHIENPLLQKTAGSVREKKRAAYQENILRELLTDINLQ